MQITSCLELYPIQINMPFKYYHMQIFTAQNTEFDLEFILNM